MMERIGDHLIYLTENATGSILGVVYCDLLDIYVKMRKLFIQTEGELSSR